MIMRESAEGDVEGDGNGGREEDRCASYLSAVYRQLSRENIRSVIINKTCNKRFSMAVQMASISTTRRTGSLFVCLSNSSFTSSSSSGGGGIITTTVVVVVVAMGLVPDVHTRFLPRTRCSDGRKRDPFNFISPVPASILSTPRSDEVPRKRNSLSRAFYERSLSAPISL